MHFMILLRKWWPFFPASMCQVGTSLIKWQGKTLVLNPIARTCFNNQSHISQNVPVPYPKMHHFVIEMCTCAHFCYQMVHCGILDVMWICQICLFKVVTNPLVTPLRTTLFTTVCFTKVDVVCSKVVVHSSWLIDKAGADVPFVLDYRWSCYLELFYFR